MEIKKYNNILKKNRIKESVSDKFIPRPYKTIASKIKAEAIAKSICKKTLQP